MEPPLELLEFEAGITPKCRSTVADAAIDFTGGTLGGITSVYVGQPLDTVKVKMQTFPTLYKNGLDCFLKTYKQDGIARGLYAGTVPSLAANISENAVLFCFYGVCQKLVAKVMGGKEISSLNPLENAVSGGLAAFFSSFALCPTELIKCRLQAMREMATKGHLEGGLERLKIGPYGLTREILKAEGVRGLYKGLTATFLREMPGYFFFFGFYEVSRLMLTPKGKTKDEIGALKTVICGGLAGVGLWVAIFPADVVKSRIQVQSVSGTPPTFRTVFINILRQEGPKALYRGLGPTVIRTFPATGALFLAYETTKKYLSMFYDYLADSKH
ncbi:mitochondrial ornithine transporter 1 [Biomphalaria glabrata]|uniref:Mitochondrial ornithine transporter 1-like n=1 Tax=Biomphalaria glabrata TaxID=6526 RepID=A0A9W3B6W4_BIOGL|nr:mitochondrial ornithine transporter 1-like [Biomphalaria glabrata]XP_055895182.1 mitochondrial ornithine transporter 1-like [Biomphalaria glabrata]XP_055895183.1 mitochondrial ornithine transporter 1-like [Biomphalaria glabrata]XP_055895184.1 mitochondrial ornithine transporter 1-like [Biomphalaria glabrata]KAI8756416.1 mitochondrial ornithine transporter 1-like [Biomphalaria glabrata]KAI8797807.1 mitochondrial ornithine transporter 1 [Biomphalaria glabrata]